jgi:hypothetical protein
MPFSIGKLIDVNKFAIGVKWLEYCRFADLKRRKRIKALKGKE